LPAHSNKQYSPKLFFFSNVSIYCSAQIGQTAVGMIKAGKEYNRSRGHAREMED
jgi:hypothetical protein